MIIHSAWLHVYEIVAEAIPELEGEAGKLLSAHKGQIHNQLLDYLLFHEGFIQLQQLSGRTDFGWFIGSRIPAYGLIPSLRTYFASCATVAENNSEALRIQAIAFPGAFSVKLKSLGDMLEFEFIPASQDLPELDVIADLIFAMIDKANKTLVDEKYEYEKVFHKQVAYDQSLMNKYSQAELVSDSDKIALHIKQSWMTTPMRYADPDLVNMLRPVVDKELARVVPKNDLVQLVEEHLRQCEQPQLFTLKDFAKQLGITEIAIRRKLSEKNLKFSDLLQNFIRTECMNYLIDPSETIESIALQLGYSERAALERSFKRWYGITPAQFRDQFRLVRGLLGTDDPLDKLELMPLSDTLSKLREMLEQDCSFKEIAVEIKKDLPLTAKIISTANSAFYGAGKVYQVEDAIERVLGMSMVKNLVQIYSLQSLYSHKLNNTFNLMQLLYTSFQSEFVCRCLSAKIKFPDTITALDFINAGQFGLMGQLIFASDELDFGQDWSDRSAQAEDLLELLSWECTTFGTNAFLVTTVLLSHWGMPVNTCRLLTECARASYKETESNDMGMALNLIQQIIWARYQNSDSGSAKIDKLGQLLGLDTEKVQKCFSKAADNDADLRKLVETLV